MEALSPVAELLQDTLVAIVLVFTRVGAVIAVLPGLGEQSIPMRIKLGLTVALTMLVWPLVSVPAELAQSTMFDALPFLLSEAIVGLLLGLSVRLVLMALQFAGSIASQSASLAQLMGPGATPDPMPAIGNILVMGGIALAFSLGLHIKVVYAIAHSFEVIPAGQLPEGRDVVNWGIAKSSSVATIAFTLSAPFVISSLAYNLVLGFINRAMPQLMVAFIGAPAITASGILILLLAGPALLTAWHSHLDDALATPFGLP